MRITIFISSLLVVVVWQSRMVSAHVSDQRKNEVEWDNQEDAADENLKYMLLKLIETRQNESAVGRELEFLHREVNAFRNELKALRDELKSCHESQNFRRVAENDHVTVKWMQTSLKDLGTELNDLSQAVVKDRQTWEVFAQEWKSDQSKLHQDVKAIGQDILFLKIADEKESAQREILSTTSPAQSGSHLDQKLSRAAPQKHRHNTSLWKHPSTIHVRSKKQMERYLKELVYHIQAMARKQSQQEEMLADLRERVDEDNENSNKVKRTAVQAEELLFQDIYGKISNLEDQFKNQTTQIQLGRSHWSEINGTVERIERQHNDLEFSISASNRELRHAMDELKTVDLKLWTILKTGTTRGLEPPSSTIMP